MECLSNVYVSVDFIGGRTGLAVSAPLFGLGVALTVLGAALVYISFRFEGEVEERSAAVLFIGPFPLVLSGRNRFMLMAVAGVLLVSLLVSWLVG